VCLVKKVGTNCKSDQSIRETPIESVETIATRRMDTKDGRSQHCAMHHKGGQRNPSVYATFERNQVVFASETHLCYFLLTIEEIYLLYWMTTRYFKYLLYIMRSTNIGSFLRLLKSRNN
jgi:hypothetical protein